MRTRRITTGRRARVINGSKGRYLLSMPSSGPNRPLPGHASVDVGVFNIDSEQRRVQNLSSTINILGDVIMSRSRRHTPICGNSYATSNKIDKQIASRRFRHRQNHELRQFDEIFTVNPKEVFDMAWSGSKDGKGWFGHINNPEYFDKLMRK